MAVEIVAVGSSLGGLHAMEMILRGLPADFRPPMVLVQHRRAEAESRLIELLQGYTSVPVCEPNDRDAIQPGHIYLAPANYHLLVDDGVFSLSVDPPVWYARPSIDVLFESIADAYGDGALAFLLTGANDDGAAGARAIKRAGGRVFVQDPLTAESPVAPRAALAATRVDGLVTLEAIGPLLGRLTGGVTTPGTAVDQRVLTPE